MVSLGLLQICLLKKGGFNAFPIATHTLHRFITITRANKACIERRVALLREIRLVSACIGFGVTSMTIAECSVEDAVIDICDDFIVILETFQLILNSS